MRRIVSAAAVGASFPKYTTFSRPPLSECPADTFDRCQAKAKDKAWLAAEAARADARTLLISENDLPMYVPPRDIVTFLVGPTTLESDLPNVEAYFLGRDKAGYPYFVRAVGASERETIGSMVFAPPAPSESYKLKLVSLRSVAAQLSGHEASVVAHAKSLVEWHQVARFCGKCGTKTVVQEGGLSRKCTNAQCGLPVYPRTNPVAIMVVLSPDGNRCLLGQTKARYIGNVYSCLAGFVDQGESLEDAVRRETMEEAGVPVGDVLYHSSQPWPYSSNLMLGCIAIAETDVINFDPDEMHDVKWFTKEDVKKALAGENENLQLPPPLAIATTMVTAWVNSPENFVTKASSTSNL